MRHLYTYTLNMAQITIYVPDAVARRAQHAARRARKSLSAYVVSLLEAPGKVDRQRRARLAAAYGSWAGSFPDLRDPPPAPVKW